MVNIIAHGFENVNKIGLDCQSSRLSTHFFASFSSYHCPIHANKTAQKIALLKSKALLERITRLELATSTLARWRSTR